MDWWAGILLNFNENPEECCRGGCLLHDMPIRGVTSPAGSGQVATEKSSRPALIHIPSGCCRDSSQIRTSCIGHTRCKAGCPAVDGCDGVWLIQLSVLHTLIVVGTQSIDLGAVFSHVVLMSQLPITKACIPKFHLATSMVSYMTTNMRWCNVQGHCWCNACKGCDLLPQCKSKNEGLTSTLALCIDRCDLRYDFRSSLCSDSFMHETLTLDAMARSRMLVAKQKEHDCLRVYPWESISCASRLNDFQIHVWLWAYVPMINTTRD